MSAPVVLITGCSSGIGLASAVEFARHGFTTVATMRNLGKADELRAALTMNGLTAEIRSLDVDDLLVPQIRLHTSLQPTAVGAEN